MKKLLLALAALSVFAGVAHAQSSVTLYGIIDEGFNINTNANGQHLYTLSSGVLQSSRWGLRGTEDLGAGLKAIFALEDGLNFHSGKLGQGGFAFDRQAYVGFSGRFGTVTLGRQYDSIVDYVGPLQISNQWGGYISAHPGDLDNFSGSYRANNAIKFASANYMGFKFGGLYSRTVDDYNRYQIFSLGAGYNNGPLVLGMGYLNVRNPNASFFRNSKLSTVNPLVSNVSSPVYAGYGSAHTYQVIGGGGAYTFGATTIGATYANVKFYNLGSLYTSVFAGQEATFNNAEINFKYQLTPILLVGAAYDYTQGCKINGNSAAQYHQSSLGVDYFLSKRTDVYLIGVYQHASGNTVGADGSTIVPAVAAINGLTASSNQSQFTARIGVRHKF